MKKIFLIAVLILIFVINRAEVCGCTGLPVDLRVITAIDTTEIISIGGIKQLISIKGENKENPILLFLHGGPGSSLMEPADKFTDRLQKEFVVVQWDQRETGGTLKLNPSPKKLTVKLMQDDTYEVVKLLLKKFNHKKLYLASHSWGSVLAFNIADKYPELLSAYIAISPIIDQLKSAKLTEKTLKEWALKNKNEQALKELALVKIPFQQEEDLFYSQKWLFIRNGVEFAKKDDFKSKYYAWMSVWFPVWKESIGGNLFKDLPSVKCPVYFIEGNADGLAAHAIVEDYYKFLKAPKKDFFWFSNSGHTIFNTEPEKLQEVIITEILRKNK
ncbi:pimeloyl-ACP methyl ester carboxylesterase [Pedobacter cryoconitis]|uniref:Pimeloyl-ACP methyl ester carboxylesterase n=1 Tax=Pedobacter cryoconitis TaxID=188932 RepID=A0A7W8ZIH2_9SPHI|nr:alpha/beta hydrolase [Pedobacter cryoconitis]MBB5634505.1 pimeloyl-ACP methyl ester carboxylesterase [Pedobacter cryoconitis]